MAIQCPEGWVWSEKEQACVRAGSTAATGGAGSDLAPRTQVIQSQNGHTYLINADTGDVIRDLGADPKIAASAQNGGVTRSVSQSLLDPASVAIQRDTLDLERRKQDAADAKATADEANQRALLALSQGNAAEAKRQFDISAAETRRYHDLDLAARKDDSRLAQTKFAFDAYTKLQEIAANPRNFAQSYFLSRGEAVPDSLKGGASPSSLRGPGFGAFVPSFLEQTGLQTPSSPVVQGGGTPVTSALAPVPNYSKGVVEQAPQNTALDEILKRQASGSKIGMLAEGGVISEPIVGFGLDSGKVYTLGEEAPDKPETVVPHGKTLADVRGMSGRDGAYDTGGELGYSVGTEKAAADNVALRQLLGSLTGTSLSKSIQPTPTTAPTTTPKPATIAVAPSPYNTFDKVQTASPSVPTNPANVTPDLTGLYTGTDQNTALQAFRADGAVPPFLQRIMRQQQGDARFGTATPQRFVLPKEVPLVSALAYSQLSPSEQQGLLSYVSAYGVDPNDYLDAVRSNVPQRSPGLPSFLFLQQR